jgi:hypothetical protein
MVAQDRLAASRPARRITSRAGYWSWLRVAMVVVAVAQRRLGHTSVSFTLDRYGYLYPESDAALRDRLDAIYSSGQRDQVAAVLDLLQERLRPSAAPERGERRRHSTGNGSDLDGAARRWEDHQGPGAALSVQVGLAAQ